MKLPATARMALGLVGVVTLLLIAGALSAAATTPTTLFFSEYIEGSSNNKALEIYNGTGAPIDLAAGSWSVQMYFNGSTTAGTSVPLTGTVADGDVYVLAQSSADAAILAQADQTSSASWYNGDDAVVLRQGGAAGPIVDVIGQIGTDPGTEWGSGLTSTADNTLRRQATVTGGDVNGTDAFDPATEWDGFAVDTSDGLGSHSIDTGPSGLTLTVNDVTKSEGNVGTTTFTFIVSLTAPAGAGGVTFDLATADGGASTADDDYVAKSLTGQTIPEGSSTYTFDVLVNGDTSFEPTESFFVNVTTVAGTGVTVADGQGEGTIQNDDIDCAAAFTPISEIQGAGATTPIPGTVTTKGVVVGDYESSGSLRGFYLQSHVPDANPGTSEGVFVFNGLNDSVSVGDVAYVTGTAEEFQDQTQIGNVTSVYTCGTDTVTPVDVTFPVASPTFLEQYEGMLVRMPQAMFVSEHFQLGRFGQVTLSSGGRLQQPTNVVAPGAPALALQAENNLNRIILDDASQLQNPDPIVFGRGGLPLSAANTLRGGDTAANIVGVMTYTWAGNGASGNAYRVRPVNAMGGTALFMPTNPRPASAPAVGGTLQVVGMNLLNFFNTFTGCTGGVGGAPLDCRGASNAGEFARQWPKTVAAILAMNPDVIGINEIENDGYGPTSAIQFLVDRLNQATVPGTFAFIDVDTDTAQVNAMGADAIKVGLLYKPAKVTPVGQTAALNSIAFVNGGESGPRNRPSVAQAFQENATGARFIVDVNHLKSKGTGCTAPDAGDGQGLCNGVRVNAANALTAWLATDPTGTGDPDILLIGDYNSYAKEDPITAIKSAGYTNLIESLVGPGAYSYVFDGQWGYLDHALGSASLVGQLSGVGDYHINADEPSVLDYLEDFKSPGQLVSLYAPDQFRVSDHDPVVVGLSLNDAPTVDAGGPYSVFAGFTVTVTATGSDPNGDSLAYAWDLDDNGSFETPGQSATFDASIATPGPHTITVRATDPGDLSAVDTATVNVTVTYDSLCALTKSLVTKKGVEDELCMKLEQAEKAAAKGKTQDHDKKLEEYRKKLDQETGKAVSATSAARLKSLSLYL